MRYTEHSRILGKPDAKASEIAPRFVSAMQRKSVALGQKKTLYTPEEVISVIIPAYEEVCEATGIDWLVALCQMAKETGFLTSWWCARPRRNPAGISVTGETRAGDQSTPPLSGAWAWNGKQWVKGVAFASWADDAIPAHIGRLLAYNFDVGQGNALQQSLITKALRYHDIDRVVRGSAQTLKPLSKAHNRTKRGWAADAGYGASIAKYANELQGI